MQHPSACFAPEGKADQLECLTETSGATSIGSDDAGQALAEEPPGAVRVRTDEATDGELDGDGDTVPREIGQRPDIAAVHTGGGDATERAGGTGGCCGHEDGDSGSVDAEQIETKTRGIGKKGGRHEAGP
jgi:hypothetical protein